MTLGMMPHKIYRYSKIFSRNFLYEEVILSILLYTAKLFEYIIVYLILDSY